MLHVHVHVHIDMYMYVLLCTVTCTCTLITSLSFFSREIPHPVTLSWTMDDALIRWNTSVSVFAHIFLAEGPGSESCNFLDTRAGFASRMARFRHQVSVCVCVSVTELHYNTVLCKL